jgi:thioesterase DpgC
MGLSTGAALDGACAALRDRDARLAELPPKPARSAAQQASAAELLAGGHAHRDAVLTEYAGAVYAELTDGLRQELWLDDVVDGAAERFPGLVPGSRQLGTERWRPQRDKDGIETGQALFCAHLLADPVSGSHLLGAMARARPESAALAALMRDSDSADLGPVGVRRDGEIGYVTFQNHGSLNAEDDESTACLETAIDWVLRDDRVRVGVLRGAPATHPKWAPRRIFGSGINLTRLYEGRISLLGFFLRRELGLVDKMYRGQAVDGVRREKPWIAAVDGFAIGGACQLLLVMDRVVAEQGAYLTLPASREGIVPGCGPLRLPRFVGEALAREALLFERRFDVDSPDGARLVGAVVPAEDMDGEITASAYRLLESGSTSVRANRRALREAVEPLDTFRRYLATYAREQAACLYSPELIRNLERSWVSRAR